MYSEEEYIQLSALQHFIFCPRQCALAYMELSWAENELTALGHILHDKVHQSISEKRKDLLLARGLRISSARLGLSGQADMVEFHRDKNASGVALSGYSGRWRAFPVEYKLGRPKNDFSDEAQLCAQALCLEEMLQTLIPEGALFYGKNRRRHAVLFDENLRTLTEETANKIHQMFASGVTPAAEYSKKCQNCSLLEICLPQQSQRRGQVSKYLNKIYEDFL